MKYVVRNKIRVTTPDGYVLRFNKVSEIARFTGLSPVSIYARLNDPTKPSEGWLFEKEQDLDSTE